MWWLSVYLVLLYAYNVPLFFFMFNQHCGYFIDLTCKALLGYKNCMHACTVEREICEKYIGVVSWNPHYQMSCLMTVQNNSGVKTTALPPLLTSVSVIAPCGQAITIFVLLKRNSDKQN